MQRQQIIVPDKFPQFINETVEKLFGKQLDFWQYCPNLYNEMLTTDNLAQTIKQAFSHLDLTNSQIQIIQKLFKQLISIYQNFDKVIFQLRYHKVIIALHDQEMHRRKFQAFLLRDLLYLRSFYMKLENQYNVSIKQKEKLAEIFKSNVINEKSQQIFIRQIDQFLCQDQLECKFKNQKAKQLIISKMQAIQQIKQLLCSLNSIILMDVIDFIYSNFQQNDLKQVQSEDEFIKRVEACLVKELKNIQPAKRKLPLQKLYCFRDNLNIEAISAVLKQFRIVKDIKSIDNEFIMKIYGLNQKQHNKSTMPVQLQRMDISQIIKKSFSSQIKPFELSNSSLSILNFKNDSQVESESDEPEPIITLTPRNNQKFFPNKILKQQSPRSVNSNNNKNGNNNNKKNDIKANQSNNQTVNQNNNQTVNQSNNQKINQNNNQKSNQNNENRRQKRKNDVKPQLSESNFPGVDMTLKKQNEIKKIQNQINKIQQSTYKKQCFQTLFRRLHIAGLKSDFDYIKKLCEIIKQLLITYQFTTKIKLVQEVLKPLVSVTDKIKQINQLRRSILCLDLDGVITTKKQIQSCVQCKAANAIIIIGVTGAGKSTLIVAGSGYSLVYSQQTKDYRPSDPQVAKRIIISNGILSETTRPNISKVSYAWTTQKTKQTLIIDTPGVGQNRSSQIDIINNYSTIKMLKLLKSARIVIALTWKQFDGRCYEQIKMFIKNIANYIRFSVFERSVSFVFTKKLTAQIVSSKLIQFFASQQQKQIQWSQNQQHFIKCLEKHFCSQQLKDFNDFQIIDPSTHQYEYLMKKILQKMPTQSPGQFFSSTYTATTMRKLDQTSSYLQKMVNKTFERSQFELTKYYLNQMKQLQDIDTNKNIYQPTLTNLKSTIQGKLPQVSISIQRYYIDHFKENIDTILDIKQFVEDIQNNKYILSLFYKEGQQTAKAKYEQLINHTFKQALQDFKTPSKIPMNKRRDALASLTLIQNLLGDNNYQTIRHLIINDKTNNQKNVQDALQSKNLSKQVWKDVVDSFVNQFNLQCQTVQLLDNFKKLVAIVQKFLAQSIQLQNINSLIITAKTDTTGGQLQKTAFSYLSKLQIVKQEHYMLKQIIQPYVERIIKLFEETLIYFKNQKLKNIKQKNINSASMWNKFEKNSKEIELILIKFSKSTIAQYNCIKQQQWTLNQTQQTIYELIKKLEDQIDLLPLNPKSIDPPSLKKLIYKIFQQLEFIRSMKYANQKFEHKNQIHMQILEQTVLKSQQDILRIKRKIQRTSNTTFVQNYQLNYKLILCHLIVKQFSYIYSSYLSKAQKSNEKIQSILDELSRSQNSIQKPKQQLEQLACKIQKKLLSPLEQIKTVKINKYYFDKLFKVLKYLKNYSDTTIGISNKSQTFFPYNFKEDPQPKAILKTSFIQIKKEYDNFQNIRNLHKYQQQIGFLKDSRKDQFIQKKSQIIDQFRLKLCQDAAQYILSYDQIQLIVQNFKGFHQVQEFKCNQLQNLNLQLSLQNRLYNIDKLVSDKHQSQSLTRFDLFELKRQFQFLYDILTKAKEPERQNRLKGFKQTQGKINTLIAAISKTFEDRVENVALKYKSVKNGVDFQDFKDILQHQNYKKDSKYQVKINKIFSQIDSQYIKLMKEDYINFDPRQIISQKTQIFLNISQFSAIAFDNKYQKSKKQEWQNLQTKNCNNFFTQLKNSFQQILYKLQKGISYEYQQYQQLSRIQKKIIIYLDSKYKLFLKAQFKDNTPQTLQQWFKGHQSEILKNLSNKYMSQNVIYDDSYKQTYTNSKQKFKMKECVIKRKNQQVQKLKTHLEKNLQEFDKTLDQIKKSIQKLPQQLQIQVYAKDILQINAERQNKQKIYMQNIDTALSKNKIQDLINVYVQVTNNNNQRIVKLIQNKIKQYFQQQQNKIDFNQLDKLKIILDLSTNFFKDKLLKKNNFLLEVQNKFLKSLQKNTQLRIKYFTFYLDNHCTQIISKNPLQKFRLYNFMYISSLADNLLQTLNLIQTYQILNAQKQKSIQLIQKVITQTNTSSKRFIQQLKLYQNKLINRNGIINKSDVIKTLMLAIIYKQKLIQFGIFRNVPSIKTKSSIVEIQEFKSITLSIINIIKAKYNFVLKWNIQEFITNDSIDRIKDRNKQMQIDIQILNDIAYIFINAPEFNQKTKIQIQQKNQLKIRLFEQQVFKQIQLSFKQQNQIKSQYTVKYFTLQSVLRQTKTNIFPSGTKLNPQIKKTLQNNMNKLNQRIDRFITDNTKIKKFKDYLSSLDAITAKYNSKLQAYEKVLKIDRQKYQMTHTQQLKIALQKVSKEDKDFDSKQKIIKRQYESNKITKQNDFKTMKSNQAKNFDDMAILQKDKIVVLINEFLKSQISLDLIINRRVRTMFSCFQLILKYPIKIQNQLEKIERSYSKKITKYLYNCLQSFDSPYSQLIIKQQKIFTIFTKQQFKILTSGQKFDILVKQIPDLANNRSKQERIMINFKNYQQKYDQILNQYNKAPDSNDKLKNIIEDTKRLGKQLKKQYQQNDNSNVERYNLLAHVFAVWTIIKAVKDQNGNNVFVYRPHDGQLLALFLLLQFDNVTPQNKITKSMIQVSTGQGKSVILAALSAYLALVGFDVYEACYSQYLSSRDYSQFKQLFNCLGLGKMIKYNIFPQICKMMLDESPQNPFTDKVQQSIFNATLWDKFRCSFLQSMLPQNNNNKVLLIDEVDGFIDQNYIGQSYLPSVSIKSKAARKLLDFVWSLRNQKQIEPRTIISSKQFQDVCKQIKNPIFKQIMQNQTQAMIRDLLSFKQDDYSLINRKIFYKQGDGLSDKIHYGYRTIFSYYNQYQLQNIDFNELNNQAVIRLTVASFSYAKLPQYFNTILGVTGTLESMSKGQKKILQEKFGVQKRYIQPSIYSKSSRTIQFKKCWNKKLFSQIVKNIDEQHAKKRPITVFFATKYQTYNFFQSKEFAKYKFNSAIITYEAKENDRDYRINVSAQQRKITLLTLDFSRGTDFKLNVKDSKSHLGLHVISAFLPESFADYIQLIGRTARQGSNGSVTIFIVSDVQIRENQSFLQQKKAQELIKLKDNEHWQVKQKQISDKIKKANLQHDNFVKIYSTTSGIDAMFNKIKQLNYQKPLTIFKSRTAILIDATSSMSSVFKKLKTLIQNAMPDICSTISNSNFIASFEIQFVIYRNYNSPYQLLLQHSSFQNKSQNLVKWIKDISVSGGLGNEAIEVCLQHVNKLQSLNQFIIIADARANDITKNQIKSKRAQQGESYWNSHGFQITDYQTEITKLIQKKVKGHSYYIKTKYSDPKQFFETLSKRTGGKCELFDPQGKESTKGFVDFVAERILENLGDVIGGEAKSKLIKQYAQISCKKRYT